MSQPSPQTPQQILQTQLSTALTSKSPHLHPTKNWLTSFLTSQRANTPLPALVQTATFRLLASDITVTLAPAERQICFPGDVGDVGVREGRLRYGQGEGEGEGGVVTQVLAVEDMSKSRWEQVEAIEALERGEGTKGREIIRVPRTTDAAGGEDEGGGVGGGTAVGAVAGVQRGGGPHKLLLQDASGKKVWAMELKAVEGIGAGMPIGCKVLLKGARVARGMVLLEPETTSFLGGKVEEMQVQWRERRKVELKAQLDVPVDGTTV